MWKKYKIVISLYFFIFETHITCLCGKVSVILANTRGNPTSTSSIPHLFHHPVSFYEVGSKRAG